MMVWTLTDNCVRRTIEFFLLQQTNQQLVSPKNPEASVKPANRNQLDTNPLGQVSLH